MSNLPFASAVAKRCGLDDDLVDQILARQGVIASPTPPPARPLRLSRIHFSGVKRIPDVLDEPFEFDWSHLESGLWAIASDGNFVGKSTIIQVALWALRGAPKHLTRVVESWIQRVECDFIVDKNVVRVRFDVADGVPKGEVATTRTTLTFQTREAFQRAMQEVMLASLGLDPIPATQQRGVGDVIRYDDGWLAYTGAFISDSYSNALIGELVGGLTQRLLQVFLGIPWATTLFQARAAAKLLQNEADQRQRKARSLGGRSVGHLEAELAQILKKIDNEASRNSIAESLRVTQAEFDNIQQRISDARAQIIERKELVEETSQEATRAERERLDIEEGTRASAFFKLLQPVECPRCSTPIGEQRKIRESATQECSVCTTVATAPELAESDQQITEAQRRVTAAKKHRTDAQAMLAAAEKQLAELEVARVPLADALARLSKLGTAADMQVLRSRADRIEGMLEIAREITGSVDDTEDQALAVIQAAEIEAQDRTETAAASVLERVSDEVTRIVRRLGMRDVDHVFIKRNAHVNLTKGGTITHFGGLTPGEQLRLRIATILALVRTAKDVGIGRHPGLLFIDSPANEEMENQTLAELLREVSDTANEVGDIQIIIAMVGLEEAKIAVAPDRLRTAAAGEFLW